MQHDAALDALFLPFRHGVLAWPTQAPLFLRARMGAALLQHLPRPACVQSFKPAADALQRVGIVVHATRPDGTHPLILVLPPRQREEARSLLATAFDACEEGGHVLISTPNDAGAKSMEKDLAAVAGGLEGQLTKFHCRVAWARKDSARHDAALLSSWRTLDAPRRIGDGFLSRPGVFAWDRIDAGSALLAEVLPSDLSGHVADFGAGWGYLADAVLSRNPRVTRLSLFEAEARALDLARQNLATHADRVAVDFHWHDVTAGVEGRFDAVVMNPPFHGLHAEPRPDLGQAFIDAAARALRPDGRLWLVANRKLAYEDVLARGFSQAREVIQRDGFKVIEAIMAAR